MSEAISRRAALSSVFVPHAGTDMAKELSMTQTVIISVVTIVVSLIIFSIAALFVGV